MIVFDVDFNSRVRPELHDITPNPEDYRDMASNDDETHKDIGT
jgi:hypothetical protein